MKKVTKLPQPNDFSCDMYNTGEDYFYGKDCMKKPTKEQEIEITQYVEKILQLNEKLLKIGDKLPDERAVIEDEIKKTDSEIDMLYTLLLEKNENKNLDDDFSMLKIIFV